MGTTTSRLALPYPVSTDADNVPGDMGNLANALDPIIPKYQSVSSLPAAGNAGFIYLLTTTGVYYVDTGSALVALGRGLPLSLTGATAATRYAGGTTSGSPGSGTFAAGDFVVDQTGKIWICTVAGTPGTWTQGGAGSLTTAYGTLVSPVVLTTVDAAIMTTSSLSTGTWKIDATFVAQVTAPGAGVHLSGGSGVGTVLGPNQVDFTNNSGNNVTYTWSFLLNVTTAGTFTFAASTSNSNEATIEASGYYTGNPTGWIAIKVA